MATRKPFSASDVLRAVSPRKMIANSFLTVNKFNHLSRDNSPARDSSPGPDNRARLGSTSQKRKNSDNNNTYAGACSGSGSASGGESLAPVQPRDDSYMMSLVKVKSLCEKADCEIGEANADVTVLAVLKTLNESIRGLCEAAIQKEERLAAAVPAPAKGPDRDGFTMVSLGTISKRQRVGPAPVAQVTGAEPARRTDMAIVNDTTDNIPPDMQRFKDAVKSAEKSTLVFNLDLGRTPILNTDTMSKRATLALTSMAAVAEGRSKDNPSSESIGVIDDVLSIVTGIHFFGNTTKSYHNPRDPTNSGSYCTIPIKYDFNDKDSRILAETVLRNKCNVHCTTPYPPILRECIRRVINGTKQ
jgi:hypothetical protein